MLPRPPALARSHRFQPWQAVIPLLRVANSSPSRSILDLDGDLHAKRILSLTNATLGVIKTASLAVNTIGQGLALARGLVTKHAIKQVDRLLSNEGIDIDAALRHWVPYVVGP